MKTPRLIMLLFWVGLCMGCQPITAEIDHVAHQSSGVSAIPITTTTMTAPIAPTVALTVTNTLALTETFASLPPASDELLAYGRELYRKQYCGLCHQSTAAGTGGIFGPSHDGLGTLAAQRIADPNYQGSATTAEAYLYESLIDPQRYTVPGYELTPHRMPIYTFLSAQELDALVHFLLYQ